MSIAGSDSGGGAGIQADLKTFTALGVWGTTAVTCLTAQNPLAVRAVTAVSPMMVKRQIDAICEGFDVRAVKTGMLYNVGIIREVARTLARRNFQFVVVDPVMVATSGARLLRKDAVEALCSYLLPLATVVTPNVPEAEVLAGITIADLKDQRQAAQIIAEKYKIACVVKGGHISGRHCVDVLNVGGAAWCFKHTRVKARNTHGTGCTFSAALAAGLAQGRTLSDAVRRARLYVRRMLVVGNTSS
jgi:hydroxymethylpyrimidine kinase/phosphomethylpyrimidine kinase